MKRLMLTAALAASCFAANAATTELCGVDSKYDISLDSNRLLFEKSGLQPAKVEMRHGLLILDGREISLSDEDRTRIARYEATVRALVPQAKAIARDAADIAFTAVAEVAAAFSGDANAASTRARLNDIRSGVRDRIDAAFDKRPWHDDEFDDMVEATMKELLPVIIGEVAGKAVAMALAGDEKGAAELEARAEKLKGDIESRIDTQTQQLAARAAALCPMVAQLGAIENSLDLRLDGDRLKILEIRWK
jgi:hypothetical protein